MIDWWKKLFCLLGVHEWRVREATNGYLESVRIINGVESSVDLQRCYLVKMCKHCRKTDQDVLKGHYETEYLIDWD